MGLTVNRDLYSMEPGEFDGISEWKQWAYQLKNRAVRSEEIQKKVQREISTLKQDIKQKDQAFIMYKRQIKDLENTINSIKQQPAYQIAKFILSIKGRLVGSCKLLHKKFS